ncbi:PaaI family thioesterase [Nocardia farcinica]|uniref:PaaI family thioesterase n=1 Tax=Nocardia farcinica TaxID=37329 RepID=UPI002455736A|nr:PaaI family thioesterase [Nocardia farcinica]
MDERDVDEFDCARRKYEPLTSSVRRLVDLTIRSEADERAVAAAEKLIDAATRLLSRRTLPGSYGIPRTADGRAMPWGNAAIGLRNPIAPPLVLHRAPDDSMWCVADLGAAYEGPPGCVHGGVSALVLDQLLGAVAQRPGEPAVTGTLTVRYLRPVPLGRIRGEASVRSHEGVKTFASGRIVVARQPAVLADGVFIRPGSRS